VDEDALDVVLRGHAEEGVEVALLGVDAAVGDEADEVEGLAAVGAFMATRVGSVKNSPARWRGRCG
jgi:hypothetical protein